MAAAVAVVATVAVAAATVVVAARMKKPFKGFSNCHETILTKRGVLSKGLKVSTREEKKIYWIDLRMPLQVCVSNFVPGN